MVGSSKRDLAEEPQDLGAVAPNPAYCFPNALPAEVPIFVVDAGYAGVEARVLTSPPETVVST